MVLVAEVVTSTVWLPFDATTGVTPSATDDAVEAPPPSAVVGGTVNLDGRAVDVRNTLGWLVISHGGTTGRCVLVVVS